MGLKVWPFENMFFLLFGIRILAKYKMLQKQDKKTLPLYSNSYFPFASNLVRGLVYYVVGRGNLSGQWFPAFLRMDRAPAKFLHIYMNT